MTCSVLLCTSFRAHRIKNCCAHYPRSRVSGGHFVWCCDFSFQKMWVCSHHGEMVSHETLREFQQGGEKTPRGFWRARCQLHQNDRKGHIRILHSYFLLREVASRIFPCWPPELVSRDKISPIKVLKGFKTAFLYLCWAVVMVKWDTLHYFWLLISIQDGFFSHTSIT